VAGSLAILAVACTVFDGAATGNGGFAALTDASDDVNDPGEGGADGGVRTVSAKNAYLPLAEAARACSHVSTCPFLATSIAESMGLLLPNTNFSACVDWLAGPLPTDRPGLPIQRTSLACVALARTCEEAGRCLAIEYLGPANPRCAGETATPDGGPLATRCSDDDSVVIDCNVDQLLHCSHPSYGRNARCLVGDDGNASCAVDRNCNTGGGECLGTFFTSCNPGNVRQVWDCPASGYTCGPDPSADAGLNGLSACLQGGSVRPCDQVVSTCVGDVVSTCDGFDWSDFNCASIGAKCVKTDGLPHCTRTQDACTPSSDAIGMCDGTSIALCVGGETVHFDCAQIRETCVAPPGQHARCGPA
jgi:hypothetical protein